MRIKLSVNAKQNILWLKKELVDAGWDRDIEAEVDEDIIVLMLPGATLLEIERSLNGIAETIRAQVLEEYLGRAIRKEVKDE